MRRIECTPRVSRATRTPWARWLGVLVVLWAAAGCVTTPESKIRSGERLLREGKVDEAVELFEQVAREAPENVRAHVVLGSLYLDRAQAALRDGDEIAYLKLLERSQDELLRAVELDPDEPSAHNTLGVLAALRGDMDGAYQSFRIAVQLDPLNPGPYLNLAEVNVYLGKAARARRNIDLARKFGAPPGPVEMVEVLAAWRRGDYVEARDIFEDVAILDPNVARTWNGASDIATFEDLVAHCCTKTEFCGPNMERSCQEMDLRVEGRKRDLETRKRELELQAEREKRITDVYKNRKDIEISVEDEPDDEAEPEP